MALYIIYPCVFSSYVHLMLYCTQI